jgi:hypothetical protein
VVAVNTLLGPEGTSTAPLRWGLLGSSGLPEPVCTTALVGGGVVCGGWFGVGCCLRIAQWTRASLWSSCQGQTVNALAPGADEGRGRPR